MRDKFQISNLRFKILHREFGFTLIEVLVAISILALIGVVAIPNLGRFNDSQTLQNTTSDLVRVFRQAQSAANSKISCSGALISQEWQVTVSSNSYQLLDSCYNPISSASPISDPHYSPNPMSLSGITFQISTPAAFCSLPTVVHFGSEYKPYDQNRFSNITFDCNNNLDSLMKVDITYQSQHQYVCVDKGGAIYATATPCF